MRNKINTPASLLSVFDSSDVVMDPYPHIIARNVLTEDFLSQLLQAFPNTERVTKNNQYGSNQRFDYTIEDLRKDSQIASVLREFVEAQADQNFYDDFFRVFGPAIKKYYPQILEKNLNNEIKLGTRHIDSHKNVDLLADAHISINTPVIDKPTSVRNSHVDDPKKLYGALFYMRGPGDTSVGGNLQISKLRNLEAKFFGQTIDDKDVLVVNEIPYKANTFVFFLNTIHSIHGVTPRSKTTHQRQFINLVAEFKEPLFDIQSRQENIWIRRARVLMSKIKFK